MQTINGITYRNLQEQVEQNKNDIAAWHDAAKFDIRTVGQCATVDDLPDPSTFPGDYGDMYAVGTAAPYTYYIFTRPTADMTYPYWFNAGQLQIQGDKGDQGETGPAGPTGERGSLWTTSNSNPSVMSTTKKNDQHLCVYNGDVFQFDGSAWNRIGNIRGPQGIQGAQGIQGPKGDTGETGPKGDTGDVGGFINIVATLKSADLLPDPATLSNLTYAYLVGDNNDLYIQIGKNSVEAHWKNMGSFNLTANHWTVNTSNQLVPANNDDVAVNNLTVLGTSSLKSPSISGVAACSAISSPATLTLSGTDGAEVLVNGTNTLTANSDGITLPTLADPGDNQSYPVLMADSNGKILKNTGITVNPYAKSLTADGLAVGANGITVSGKSRMNGEIIFDADSANYEANTCGIMRYQKHLMLGDYDGNGISISKIGSNESVIKQTPHSGEMTYTLPSASGTLLSYADTSTQEYNRLSHDITLPVQQPSDAQGSGYRHVSGTVGRFYIDQYLSANINMGAYYNKAELVISASQQPVCVEFFKNGTSTIGCRMTCNSDIFILIDQDRDYNYYGTIDIWCPAEGKFYSSNYTTGNLVFHSANGQLFNIRGDLYTDKTIINSGYPSWYTGTGTSEINVKYTALTDGENTFTGKTYVNTGIGNARIGAEYLNSDSKWGVDIPLTTQTAVAYRITSCGPKDDACTLSALTSSTGGAVFESTIGELCDTFGNVLTIVFNQDGIYINRTQVSTESSTGYLQITGYAGSPIIIEQLI